MPRRPAYVHACDGAAAEDVDGDHLVGARVGHERVPRVRAGSGVTRLVEATDDASNAQARPVDERDDALRSVTDDSDFPPDALDAARPCDGGDRAQDLAGGELNDGDASLRVGGDERDRRSTGKRHRSEAQGDRQRRRADQELAAVHVRDTGSGC